MSNLFLITARAGSKGVPNKNLRPISGLSLIGWKARAAKAAMKPGDRLIISTESYAIQGDAKFFNVEIPFTRPVELATDTASSASVIKHALENIDGEYKTVVLLEPSSPFTRGSDIIAALTIKEAKNAHLVVGMKHVEPHTTFIAEQPDDDCVTPIMVKMGRVGRNLRRQDLKPEWTMNGALYVFDTEMFLKTGSIYGGARNYGLLMDKWHSIEIDSMDDLEMAEYAFLKGYVTP